MNSSSVLVSEFEQQLKLCEAETSKSDSGIDEEELSQSQCPRLSSSESEVHGSCHECCISDVNFDLQYLMNLLDPMSLLFEFLSFKDRFSLMLVSANCSHLVRSQFQSLKFVDLDTIAPHYVPRPLKYSEESNFSDNNNDNGVFSSGKETFEAERKSQLPQKVFMSRIRKIRLLSGMDWILRACPNIQEVRGMDYFWYFGSSATGSLKNLRRLSIEMTEYWAENSQSADPDYNYTDKVLHLSNIFRNNADKLEYLRLSGDFTQTSDPKFAFFRMAMLRAVRVLDLYNVTHLNPDFLSLLLPTPWNLEHLELSNISEFSDSGVEALASCKNLKILRIKCCGLEPFRRIIGALVQGGINVRQLIFGNLTSLQVQELNHILPEHLKGVQLKFRIEDAIDTFPQRLRHLNIRFLGLHVYELTDADLSQIRLIKTVEKLSLLGIRSRHRLDHLQELPNLKQLELSFLESCTVNLDLPLETLSVLLRCRNLFSVHFNFGPHIYRSLRNLFVTLCQRSYYKEGIRSLLMLPRKASGLRYLAFDVDENFQDLTPAHFLGACAENNHLVPRSLEEVHLGVVHAGSLSELQYVPWNSLPSIRKIGIHFDVKDVDKLVYDSRTALQKIQRLLPPNVKLEIKKYSPIKFYYQLTSHDNR